MSERDNRTYELIPIGVIHSEFDEQSGTPIQGVFAPENHGTVEIFEPYVEGLKDIDGFDYVWLVFGFDRSQGYSLTVRPYLDDTAHGLFTTRAPRRPNQIGLSLVRLLKREENVLRIAEVDILDGAPLFDIKPYIPAFDTRPEPVRCGWAQDKFRSDDRPKADGRFAE